MADTAVVSNTAEWPQTLSEFERLVDRTQHELVHFAFYMLAQRADAEDAVQDVFVQAWRDRAKYEHVTEVRPYLFRMLRNRCTDVLRARKRQRGGAEFTAVPEPSCDPSALRDAVARDEALEFRRLLDQVPAKEADVIRLRVWAELPFAEIAAVVQASVPTAKSRFRYGLERLRRLLTTPGQGQRGRER